MSLPPGRWLHAHERERLRADQPHAVELAAAAQHLAEAQVVGRGADQAAAARRRARRREEVARLRGRERARGRAHVAVGEARDASLRARGSRVVHAERLRGCGVRTNSSNGMPRGEGHEVADDVGRDAVVPRAARRELERHAGQPLDQRFEALGLEGVEAKLAVRGVDVGAVLKAVGKARGVAQQVDARASAHRPAASLNAPGCPARYTVRSRHDGIHFATGSSSAMRPSSTSIMSAMLVTGLVIE